jgi:hypothetical protein
MRVLDAAANADADADAVAVADVGTVDGCAVHAFNRYRF